MTSPDPLSPNHTITIAGKDYLLDGSFATLRAVQEAFKKDIVFVLGSILEMRVDEIATLIAIGSSRDANAIGQDILDTMNVMHFRVDADYYLLKTRLISWLTVAITPKDAREKKRAEMHAIIEKQKSPSPGDNTASSA